MHLAEPVTLDLEVKKPTQRMAVKKLILDAVLSSKGRNAFTILDLAALVYGDSPHRIPRNHRSSIRRAMKRVAVEFSDIVIYTPVDIPWIESHIPVLLLGAHPLAWAVAHHKIWYGWCDATAERKLIARIKCDEHQELKPGGKWHKAAERARILAGTDAVAIARVRKETAQAKAAVDAERARTLADYPCPF